MSITSDNVAQSYGFSYIEDGGVASAKGFQAAGIHAGFRANPNRLDMALVVADDVCSAAAVFTQNVFCAAPVQFCRQQLNDGIVGQSYGLARAIVINSGNANAATGVKGLEVANCEAQIVADAIGCPKDEVLVASTGVIGVQLPLEPFETGIPEAINVMSEHGGADAAQAIMTTDTYPKECAVTFTGHDFGFPDATFCIGGMAKGSGMIMPNMATMIAVLTTDAPIDDVSLHTALNSAVAKSFNKVTVDGDTSTNDSCFIMASGKAQSDEAGQDIADVAAFATGTKGYAVFEKALTQVCVTLARQLAIDGEGATKLITVNVNGAIDEKQADLAARTVANSPLVKTAVAGHDANWGRIAMAIGKSGAQFAQQDCDINIMGIPVCRAGLQVDFDEDEALKRFEEDEIFIDINLGAGDASATVWTCDLTHEYISINADYRT